jgi:AraC-like DNA-binding protein
MLNLSSFALEPAKSFSAVLSTVWKVRADRSYDIDARGRKETGSVLLRTFSGRGRIWFDGPSGSVELAPATVILFDHRRVTRYRCCSGRWNFWWAQFNALSPCVLPSCTQLRCEVSPAENGLFESMFGLLRLNSPLAAQAASSCFSFLISLFQHRCAEQLPRSVPHRARVEKTIAAMYETPAGLTVRAMARQACLCERRFRQVFESVTGKSPKQFYSMVRCEMAREMLRCSADSIGAIAGRLGYSSQFHFSKAFRERYGMSPRAFRW